MKPSTFYQLKGYAGLATMADAISEYFPKDINMYVEPFAGLGRTTKFAKSNKIHDIFEQYEDVEDMFMLIDPPWRKNIYKNNAKPVFTGNNVIGYYDDVLKYLKSAKYKWILCVDKAETEIGKRVSKSQWKNIVLEHPTKKLFNRAIGVRLATNIE